jgi:hypothetical protein
MNIIWSIASEVYFLGSQLGSDLFDQTGDVLKVDRNSGLADGNVGKWIAHLLEPILGFQSFCLKICRSSLAFSHYFYCYYS